MGSPRGQPALYGMAGDIGNKMNRPPGAGRAESGDRQPHTPVAAAYADRHDVAPAALGVGQPNEIIQPLPFGGYFIVGGGRAQSRMPGGASFGATGHAAGQQAFAP